MLSVISQWDLGKFYSTFWPLRSKGSQWSSLKEGKVKCDKTFRLFGEFFYLNSYFYPVFVILIKEDTRFF